MPQKKLIHLLELSDEQVCWLKNAYTANSNNSTLEIHRKDGKTITTLTSGSHTELATGAFLLGWLLADILMPQGYCGVPKPIP